MARQMVDELPFRVVIKAYDLKNYSTLEFPYGPYRNKSTAKSQGKQRAEVLKRNSPSLTDWRYEIEQVLSWDFVEEHYV